jgi:hypothetical protein
MEKHLLSEKIKSLAESLGLDAVGFAEAYEFSGYLLNKHQRRDFFFLPNISRLSENGYRDMFGHLNTGISYDLFHRNIIIAMGSAEKLMETASQ